MEQKKISNYMKSINNSYRENKKDNECAKPNTIIENIKSRYILSKIYDNIIYHFH